MCALIKHVTTDGKQQTSLTIICRYIKTLDNDRMWHVFTNTWGWRSCRWFLLDSCTASRSERPCEPHTALLHHTKHTIVSWLCQTLWFSYYILNTTSTTQFVEHLSPQNEMLSSFTHTLISFQKQKICAYLWNKNENIFSMFTHFFVYSLKVKVINMFKLQKVHNHESKLSCIIQTICIPLYHELILFTYTNQIPEKLGHCTNCE